MEAKAKQKYISEIKHRQITAIEVSLLGSMLMVVNSLTIGLMVNSITLILDASISMVVAVATALMYITTKKVHLPPDDSYNFGYGKFEPLTVMVHGGLVIASCIISAAYAVMNIMHVEDITNYNIPTIGVLGALIFSGLVMLYLRREAKITKSGLLRSIGVQWTNDTVFYAVIFCGFFAGLILMKRGFNHITPFIDPTMTLILVVFLIRMPLKVVMENSLELLDAVPGAPTRAKIIKVIKQHYPKGFTIQRLRSRKAGQKIFIDICLGAPNGMALVEAEMLSERIEYMLKKHFLHCDVVVSFKTSKT